MVMNDDFLKAQEVAETKAKQEAKQEAKKHICMSSPTTWIASVVREGGFRLFKGGHWDTENVTREYAYEYADSKHASKSERYCISNCKNYIHALYTDIIPYANQVFSDEDGDIGLNTYVPPTLELKPDGQHASIMRILKLITGDVPGGVEYFEDWCAAKIQNPGVRSNTAILFFGKSGTGKGTIVRAITEALGTKNCSIIDTKDLSNQSGNNGSFIDRLFTNINEVNLRDESMSDIIKNMIDGPTVKLRDKYIRTGKNGITNRNSFIFTTNIPNSVKLDAFDRRFTVFDDGIQKDVLPEYKEFIDALWDPVAKGPTDALMAEIGHWVHCLKTRVLTAERLKILQRPFETEARYRLIQRTQSTSNDFFDEELERGIDILINEYFEFKKQCSFNWVRPEIPTFIFPEKAQRDLSLSSSLSESLIYDVYKYFTQRYSPSKHVINKGMFLEAAKERGWVLGGKACNGAVRCIRGIKRSTEALKDIPKEEVQEADVISIDAQLDKQGIGH